MESSSAIRAFAALAQDSRLRIFRVLVEAGPSGLPASEIAGLIGIPTNTLSFHVKALKQAGLLMARQDGRFIFYTARFERMHALVAFLTTNCCGNKPCWPSSRPPSFEPLGAVNE